MHIHSLKQLPFINNLTSKIEIPLDLELYTNFIKKPFRYNTPKPQEKEVDYLDEATLKKILVLRVYIDSNTMK